VSDYQLNFVFLGKDEGAEDTAKAVAAALQDLGDKSEQAKPKADGLFSKFTITAGDAVHAVQAVVGVVSDVGHALIDGNAKFEQYNVAYTTLIKNSDDFKAANSTVTDSLELNALASDAAKQHMQELADFGARTPFDLPGVVEADTVLQGFGLNSSAAAEKFGFAGKEILTIAGDVASGTGVNFKEMALTLGKFSSGATGEAISRMQELGITNRDELSKLGLEFSKAGQLMSPLPEAMNTVLTLMKQKYGGLMDAQSQTFTGMMSNLDDWKGQTMRSLGEPIFEALKPQLASLLTFLGSDTTKQAIASFAHGLADGVTFVGNLASVLHDYGIPAMEGIASATAAYAMVTLPAAIPAVLTATAAFMAQAVAVAAAVAPLALIAIAVAAVTKAYSDFKQQNEDATQSLLESREWWNNSTQALHDFDGASDATKGKLSGLKTAVEENRAELQREITSLAERREAGLVSDAQYTREMETINQHRVAVTASSEALARQMQIASETDKYDAHEEALHAMVSAQNDYTQAVQATEKELADADKAIDKVYKAAPQALQTAAATTNTFLAQQAEQQATHEQKIADLEAQFADAKTTKAKEAVQAKIDAENTGYEQSSTAAAAAYAQAEAAQRAHLGKELIDYVQALAVKNTAFREKSGDLTDAIAKEYGVIEGQTTRSFGAMLNTIDGFANSTQTDASSVAHHLGLVTDAAANTQRTMDNLAKQYAIEIKEDLDAHRITAEEYARALADIPRRVETTVTTHYEHTGQRSEDDQNPRHHPEARASGGPVNASTPYLVGEAGPELFVPRTSGAIVSTPALAAALGGGAGATYNQTFLTISPGAIVINGDKGQDVTALAELVIRKITDKMTLRRT